MIDKREFRSVLPSFLYQNGFNIVPVYLRSGDYVISDNVAVERKQVWTSDLADSLISGRLEKQLAEMFTIYTKVILLVEFDIQSKNNSGYK